MGYPSLCSCFLEQDFSRLMLHTIFKWYISFSVFTHMPQWLDTILQSYSTMLLSLPFTILIHSSLKHDAPWPVACHIFSRLCNYLDSSEFFYRQTPGTWALDHLYSWNNFVIRPPNLNSSILANSSAIFLVITIVWLPFLFSFNVTVLTYSLFTLLVHAWLILSTLVLDGAPCFHFGTHRCVQYSDPISLFAKLIVQAPLSYILYPDHRKV